MRAPTQDTLLHEADIFVETPRGVVAGKDVQVDALEVEIVKGEAQEQLDGFSAMPLATRADVAEPNLQFGAPVHAADVVKLAGSDQAIAVAQPDAEDRQVGPAAEAVEPVLMLPFGDRLVRRVVQDLITIVDPGEQCGHVGLCEWSQCDLRSRQHGSSAEYYTVPVNSPQVAGVHQPNYIPWLGYFHKLANSTQFIILDNVDFQTGNAQSIISRVRIKTANGEQWITVPVKKSGRTHIADVRVDNSQPWASKQLKTIRFAYAKAPHFSQVFPVFEALLGTTHETLGSLNTAIIQRLAELLGIQTPFHVASTMPLTSEDRNLRLIEICKQVGCDTYLCGRGAREYMDVPLFEREGIRVQFTQFEPRPYPQLHGEFVPGLSTLDALFNVGIDGTRKLL